MKSFNTLKGAVPSRTIANLRDLVERTAADYGDKTQYIYKENGEVKTTSYQDRLDSVNAFGTALACKDIMGGRIAIIGETHPHWVEAFLAATNSGSVAVPLDKELDIDTIVAFVERASCCAIVYSRTFNGKLAAIADRMPTIKCYIPIAPNDDELKYPNVISYDAMLSLGKEALAAGDKRFTEHEIDMQKMCALLFTSGTTGTSKAVMLSHNNLTAAVNSSCQCTSYDYKSTFVSVLPIHHTFELTCGHLAGSNEGVTIYISEGIRYASKNFKDFKPNSLVLVPLFLETVHKRIWDTIRSKGMEKKVRAAMKLSNAMLKLGIDLRKKLFSDITSAFGGNLRSIVVGGAPLDPKIVADFYTFGILVIQGYGITECSPLVAVNRPDRVKFDSVGEAVYGCDIRINRYDNSENGEGEIEVRGENIFMGYYDDPAATRDAFTEDGWFKTGDIGYLDSEGYLKITGRKKNVIIASNGKNVYPEELEERLGKIPEIKECVVLARTDDSNKTTIVAIYYPDFELLKGVSDEDIHKRVTDAIAAVNQTVPPYKHINVVEMRHEEFEKNPSKKIKRFLLS